MATINARPNTMTTFASGDTVTVNLNTDIRKVQLVASGFDLLAATVTVSPIGTTSSETVTIPTPSPVKTVLSATIGDGDFMLDSITITGITGAGPFSVGAYQ